MDTSPTIDTERAMDRRKRLSVAHQVGQERRSPPGYFEPLGYQHQVTGRHCTVCAAMLVAGQRYTLFAVGPDDLVCAVQADRGHWYIAAAVAMHEDCAWPPPAY